MEKPHKNEQQNEELTAIIRLAMEGDEQAYTELLRKYAKYILILAHNFADIEGEEEDIAQEVAIQIFSSIGTLESPYAFTAWLRRLVLNTVNNYCDKQRRHIGHLSIDDAIAVEDKDITNSPHEAAINSDSREQLAKLIRELPASQRNALFMYYYEDMSYTEISETLGIRIGTVATNLKKAKMKLEKSLREHMNTEETAFGAAITASFNFEATRYASQQAVDKFTSSMLNANQTRMVRLTETRRLIHGSNIAEKIAIGCSALILTGALTFAILPHNNVTPPSTVPEPTTTQTVVYNLDGANIIMRSDSGQENVNPYEANLTVTDKDGAVDGYVITYESGVKLADGKGTQAAIPQTLAPGKYFITWSVTAHGVATATIKKEFYID